MGETGAERKRPRPRDRDKERETETERDGQRPRRRDTELRHRKTDRDTEGGIERLRGMDRHSTIIHLQRFKSKLGPPRGLVRGWGVVPFGFVILV